MQYPVIKGVSYALVHAPDMVLHCGTTQTTEKIVQPDSAYLKALPDHIRDFDAALCYAPNQVYIGNMTPAALKTLEAPWFDKVAETADRFGKFGEIMPQEEFILLMKISDAFALVLIEQDFMERAREKLAAHPLFAKEAADLPEGADSVEIEAAMAKGAEAIYHGGTRVGCVKKAHDLDPNLTASVLFENLAAKASAILACKHLMDKNGLLPEDVQYIIECSEEACGDMNQRGGGNFAKAIAERCGAVQATGADTRGFCAAPVHALIQAAALVQSGVYENVVVTAGGSAAKLGMNGKDHVKKGLPVLEDMLGAFAVMIGRNDGVNPVIRTDITGRHTVGTGSSPQAVISALVTEPLDRNRLKITDIDKFSVEMQNPDITKPAGAGDVAEANYKMIAALGVKRQELERAQMPAFIERHGMTGWAPTQGHIPSGVPYLGFARTELTEGPLHRVMIIGKGSLFLGRMTDLFDGVSVVLERNPGELAEMAPAGGDWAGKTAAPEKIGIGLTLLGSEHGVENLLEGARLVVAAGDGMALTLIGPKAAGERIVAQLKAETGAELNIEEAETEAAMTQKMEALLARKAIQACVTMHYDFPIGVSTVGRVVTPGLGKDMFLATTTGISALNRTEAMVKNALYGVIAAKGMGLQEPTVGILNLDGARQTESALKALQAGGYPIRFAASGRTDGGAIMRGNDVLRGTPDVMVADTLTGNVLMKTLSAYTTGGNYEAMGYGYGPGIGEHYEKLILIVSRASGSPVIANAIRYAAQLAAVDLPGLVQKEFAAARKAGLDEILNSFGKTGEKAQGEGGTTQAPPPKEVVTGEIPGIEVFDLEEAVQVLWKNGVYAESGMGCTGPVVLVSEGKKEKAEQILTAAKLLG